jgi:hypothetical protein
MAGIIAGHPKWVFLDGLDLDAMAHRTLLSQFFMYQKILRGIPTFK